LLSSQLEKKGKEFFGLFATEPQRHRGKNKRLPLMDRRRRWSRKLGAKGGMDMDKRHDRSSMFGSE